MRSELPLFHHLCGAVATYCRSLHRSQQAQQPLPLWHPHTARLVRTLTSAPEQFVSLNNLRDNPGATRSPKRVGRGIGSGSGKTSGRGHKGQKARTGRTPKLGFEGGQTPLRLRVGKRGFTNPFQKDLRTVNLDSVSQRIREGRLDTSSVITMQALQEAGLLGKKVSSGVKLLGRGASTIQLPVHLQVSEASESARKAVQAAGGSVTTVYYNQLGLRALLKPDWFAEKGRQLPRAARPPTKVGMKYDKVGELPPKTTLPQ
ncbi:hypothetical protein ABBQ32_011291 [Trebouxia sp. C0010 RCD-2024]